MSIAQLGDATAQSRPPPECHISEAARDRLLRAAGPRERRAWPAQRSDRDAGRHDLCHRPGRKRALHTATRARPWPGPRLDPHLRRICLTPGVEQDEDREDHDERTADGQDAGGAEAAGEQARDRGSGRGEVVVTSRGTASGTASANSRTENGGTGSMAGPVWPPRP